jgi:hypothetical protein
MVCTAAVRQQIESSLAARIPAALFVRLGHTPEPIPIGITEVDALLEGCLPLGSLAQRCCQARIWKMRLMTSSLGELCAPTILLY